MRYKIVSYCPDRHIEYDGTTPYKVGVGGGISARVRMAKALSRLGNHVEMVVNCKQERWIDGVHYRPLESVDRLHGDVLILNTSGGDLDLSPALELELDARLRIVWVHGVPEPPGLNQLDPDCVYAVSNFIRDIVCQEWGIPEERTFVTYNTFERDLFSSGTLSNAMRDPYKCVYFSHPSKGLYPAVKLLKVLRNLDPRFHLDVFGGEALWGGESTQSFGDEVGVNHFGLIGSQALARHLEISGYSIQLQTRQEPGALAIVEAMGAGNIVIGSVVGCFQEYIENGLDGLLYTGDPESVELLDQIATMMNILAASNSSQDYIRQNAARIPWEAMTMARVWMSHWAWLIEKQSSAMFPCLYCEGEALLLLDGYHCTQCGRYTKSIRQAFAGVERGWVAEE